MSFNFGAAYSAAKQGYSIYEDIKGRNNHERVFETNCPNMTNSYMKGSHYDGGGHHYGLCGTRKDHGRIYLCSYCYKAG
jgi:hypothetical protein